MVQYMENAWINPQYVKGVYVTNGNLYFSVRGDEEADFAVAKGYTESFCNSFMIPYVPVISLIARQKQEMESGNEG